MSLLPQRFVEDRALRDKARAVLVEDITRLKGALEEEGIASRVSSGVTSSISARIRTGARDVLDQAMAQAADRKGVLALLIGAILIWFARGPIIERIEELVSDSEDSDETETPETARPDVASPGDPE
ncbi:MAG: hypothetical protein ACKO01_07870 [Erythrobacter sp.]